MSTPVQRNPVQSGGSASVAQITARFLRMLSIALEQLEAVRQADVRAEFAGLTARAGLLEQETNELEREIEDACLAAFAAPLSEDELAFHLVVFRSLTNLERVGDYALKLARDLEHFAPRARSATLQDVLPLVRLLSEMLERLVYAFAERDVAAAREVMRLDYEQVDALYEQMQRASLTRLLERPEDTEVALTAGQIARNLERLGDHLVNVAERLEALVLGRVASYQPTHPF
ncbi:phosphate uptake regulator [Deinococcus humi]|uniref:Phosphate uptake regulator n=2 Tax=Deinococcus humi TaxID=662880 RepID=A0A7W8JWD7_9DEIO|nr:phosphate uptake regulator [Deinococcus humi]